MNTQHIASLPVAAAASSATDQVQAPDPPRLAEPLAPPLLAPPLIAQDPPACAPRHVAIIMDGNGRWARARGLPRVAGHRAGAEAVRRAIEAARASGVGWLTLYAFSSENWRRPPGEVHDLTGLLRHYLRSEVARLAEGGVKLRIIGDRTRFSDDLQRELADAERRTDHNLDFNLVMALSYGARDEIVAAARQAARDALAGTLDPNAIDEHSFAALLATTGMPDPDLILRTSGEHRLSNFLLWQAAYAEFVFLDVLWPDFAQADFAAALARICAPRTPVRCPSWLSPSPCRAASCWAAGPTLPPAPARRWCSRRWCCSAAGARGLAWLALLAIGFVLALLEWRLMARAGGIPPLAQAAAIGYAALAVAALVWLRDGPTGMVLIIFLLAVVWATDIGAYLAGRFLGGARLAPSISPGKTWSGALGGLLAAAIAGALVIALDRHLLSAPAVLIAAAISIAAQLGDLAESAAKRACGVKDSGRLIPGHGGLLDRIDGLLAAAPPACRHHARHRRRDPAMALARTARPHRPARAADAAPRSITILGSTGSIGTQTIDLIADPAAFQVRALVGGSKVDLLASQAARAARRTRGHQQPRLLRRLARRPRRHRHRGGRRPRCGHRGRLPRRRLDHGRHHRRRRSARHPRRHPPRPVRRARQQGSPGLRRRCHAARGR